MKTKNRKRRIELRAINSLKPHPRQRELFSDLSDSELNALATDMNENGLNDAVEILSDGTIVAGHQRTRAAELLDWKEIQCWVRNDLEELGLEAVEARLIEDNLHRRQLTPLDVARSYCHLRHLRKNGAYKEEDLDGDFRDQFAKRFDLSGRQLDRYLKMLDAPVEVQFAFSQPGSKVTQAEVRAVARMDDRSQRKIVNRIKAGGPAKEIIQEFIQLQAAPRNLRPSLGNLIRALERGMEVLKESYLELDDHMWGREIRVLSEAQEFFPTLITYFEQKQKDWVTTDFEWDDQFEDEDEDEFDEEE